jgi:hypothetical protein
MPNELFKSSIAVGLDENIENTPCLLREPLQDVPQAMTGAREQKRSAGNLREEHRAVTSQSSAGWADKVQAFMDQRL